MADVTVKRIEEMDSMFGGLFTRVRAELGVKSFGMSVLNLPPNFGDYPEHDHSHDGQEEIYTLLEGSATLTAGGRDYPLEPGVFARIGAGEKRKISSGGDGAKLLALGGVPGSVYEPPAYTEVGAPEPQLS